MGICTSYGVKGSETGITVFERAWNFDGSSRAVVVCHGAGETAGGSLTAGAAPYMRSLARRWPCVMHDLGGPAHWAAPPALALLDDSVAYAQSPTGLGADPDKILLWGISMGGLTALRYLQAHPEKVAACALTVPLVDLAYEHDNNIGGFAAGIQAAWGITGTYATNPTIQAINPTTIARQYTELNVPLKVWYANNDGLAVTARQLAFIGTAGCDSHDGGPVFHSYTATPDGDLDAWFAQVDTPG